MVGRIFKVIQVVQGEGSKTLFHSGGNNVGNRSHTVTAFGCVGTQERTHIIMRSRGLPQVDHRAGGLMTGSGLAAVRQTNHIALGGQSGSEGRLIRNGDLGCLLRGRNERGGIFQDGKLRLKIVFGDAQLTVVVAALVIAGRGNAEQVKAVVKHLIAVNGGEVRALHVRGIPFHRANDPARGACNGGLCAEIVEEALDCLLPAIGRFDPARGDQVLVDLRGGIRQRAACGDNRTVRIIPSQEGFQRVDVGRIGPGECVGLTAVIGLDLGDDGSGVGNADLVIAHALAVHFPNVADGRTICKFVVVLRHHIVS